MAEDDEVEWIEFPEGMSALTADLCGFFGGCEKCPGHTKAGLVQPDSQDPEAPVFCKHWCHQVGPEV
jgi:hypothetical protein